jgi:hypothetical protein
MLRLFLKNKNIQEDQKKFLFCLEKIVNIALVKTEQQDNQSVKEILKDLEDIFREFWKLKKNNPEKFEALLCSKDFFDNYVKPIEKKETLNNESYKKAKSADEIKQEVALSLSIPTLVERNLVGLTQFLNSFMKIWECAYRNSNNEISKYVILHINELLFELTCEPSNNLFIEQFLILLQSIAQKAIKIFRKDMDISIIYLASIRWYIKIIFSSQEQKGINFNLSYLELFDKYFFSSVQYIITENQISLFKGLVSSLVDGIHVPSCSEGRVWDYSIYLFVDVEKSKELNKKYRIEKIVEDLEDSLCDLDTKEKLDIWIEKFKKLKEVFEPYFNQDQRRECRDKEVEIVDFATTQFKYKNLLEIVFAIGAYCLFKQRYEFVKYLWEYKQPIDADASWIGNDIIPNNIDQVIILYFGKYLLERKFNFWEDHHGSEIYYKEYFLLLLAHVLQNVKLDSEGKYEQLEKCNLNKLNIHRISDLEHSIDDLVETANKIREKKNVLSVLGFDIENIKELFDDKLIPFLKILKEKAQKKIEEIHRERNISPEKVNKFKKGVLKGFNESIILRDIFQHYKLYKNKIKEKCERKLERIGINIVSDKAPFFDEWYIHYHDWGTNYGRDLASGENLYILEKISNNCEETNERKLDEILNKFKDSSNIIIFAINLDLYEHFEDPNSFIFKGYKNSPQFNVRGFKGWYIFKEKYIPVFGTYQKKINKQILVLNKIKLGELIQYSPLNERENEDLMEDIFYIYIQSFSEIPELINSFIKEPPEWLKKIGGEQKQREYLQEKVLVQIFERFEYVKDNDFQGYSLNLERSD